MWAVEGLTHRYPTKVLAEVLPTCPQYCGHCTRMDLVGNPTPVIAKHKFALTREDRLARHDRLPQGHPRRAGRGGIRRRRGQPALAAAGGVRRRPAGRSTASATSGWPRKALMGLPQHWLSDEVRAGMERLGATARERGVSIAIHTHVNAAQSVTPLVARAARAMLDTGIRDVRNQGVLLRGVNDSAAGAAGPELHAARWGEHPAVLLLHVRHDPRQRALAAVPGRRPRRCSTRSWGTCPGSPRRGSSATCRTWASAGCTRCPGTTPSSASRTGPRTTGPRSRPTTRSRCAGEYAYYDPIYTLPAEGRRWWLDRARRPEGAGLTPIGTSLSPIGTGLTPAPAAQ